MTNKTPEGIVKDQIKNILHLLKIPFFIHVASALSAHGVSDIIGVLPGSGRAIFIEVKKPGGVPSETQQEFLNKYAAAGAIAFVADSPQVVIDMLSAYGFQPAINIKSLFVKKT